MRVFKLAATGAIAVSMVAATSAMAAQPERSAAALPANTMMMAKNFRTATPLKRKSSQSDAGLPAVAYVAGVAAAGAIIAAVVTSNNDDHNSTPSSPG